MAFNTFGEGMVWFVARVMDTKDPKQLGRLKIRVINDQTGDFEKDIPDEHLLWAYPISAIQSASLHYLKVKESGDYEEVPEYIDAVGLSPTGISKWSYVFGFYLDGKEKNIPMVFGTYHKLSRYPEPAKDGPSKGEYNDVSRLAREENTLAEQKKPYEKGELVEEPESAYKSEYPYNVTYTSKSGHAIELDDTRGHERVHIWHKAGTYIEIDKDGRLVKKTKDDDYEIIVKDKNVLIKGDWNVEVQGAATIIVKGDCNVDIGGDCTVEAEGAINIKSDSSVSVEAPTIDLN